MSACGAVGMLLNAAGFFLIAKVFAGSDEKEWWQAYGSNNGIYFVLVTAILGLLVFPLLRRLPTE